MSLNRETIHAKIRIASLLLFALSLPFSMLVNNISIMILGVNWIFESPLKTKLKRLKENPLVYYFIIFYFAYIVGMLYTSNIRQGFFELEKKLAILLLPLIFATLEVIPGRDIRRVFKSFIFSCTVATVICFCYAVYRNYQEGHTLTYVFKAVVYDEHLPGRYAYFNYWYFTYDLFSLPIRLHPVYFSMYLVFSTCLAAWLWWDGSWVNKRKNLFLLLFFIYNFIVIVLLSSRMQLFSMSLIGTCFILYQSYLRKNIYKGIVFVFLLGCVGLLVVLFNPVIRERIIESNKPTAHYSDNKYGEGGLSLRKYKWKYTMSAISNHPVTGAGTGDAQDELVSVYRKNDFAIGIMHNFNPHNQFLQSTLALGIFGLLSLLACLLAGIRYAYRNKSWLYMIFICLFTLSCMTESMLEVNKGIVFFAFFNSLLAFHLVKNGDLHKS